MRHFLSVAAVLICACSGAAGPEGPAGPAGSAGAQGPSGPAGASPEAGAPNVTSLVSSLDLPESAPYPNSISSTADGTLFVGGLLGQVVKFDTTSTHGSLVIPQVGPQGTVLANLMVDPATSTLYACGDLFAGTAENPFANPAATLYAFDLDGKPKASYPLPNQGSSLCEDIAIGAGGTVYVTDPFLGAVDVLAGSTVTTWKTDALLQANFSNPVPPFGVHGVAVAGTNVFVGNFSTSSLFRIPVKGDGSADAMVQETASITNPERLVALDATHLLVAEDVWCGSGAVAELTQSGADAWTTTVLKNGIMGATSVTVANGSYWAVESQVCAIITQLAGGPAANPVLPFWIDRIDAD
ncbi:MAG TPA: hypothetical protein VGH28_24225 [Polyangiaceae bacterium]|jgi:hypothetical protein